MKFSHVRSLRSGLAVLLLLALTACTSWPTPHATSEFSSTLATSADPRRVQPRPWASNERPVYPMDMRRTGTAGSVNVDCVIDEAGHVVSAAVQDSTNLAFNQPTLAAVRNWNFEPGTRDGVATLTRITLAVDYRIRR